MYGIECDYAINTTRLTLGLTLGQPPISAYWIQPVVIVLHILV